MSSNAGRNVSQFGLLGRRRFVPFFVVQFLGAFNDNLYRGALVVLIALAVSDLLAEVRAHLLLAVFILPYFLFSALVGQVTDKCDKARLIRMVKLMEILVAGIAAAAIYLDRLPLAVIALFLMGVQSTLFGPVKYAILPQQLREPELMGGNALVVGSTLLAILLGNAAGTGLAGLEEGWRVWLPLVLVTLAVTGWLTSLAIPAIPGKVPDLRIDWNPVRAMWTNVRNLLGQRAVWLSILGISWFWVYAGLILAELPAFVRGDLGGDTSVVQLLVVLFAAGIGIGALLCERLSGRSVELGLVPIGAFGLTVFPATLSFAHTDAGGVLSSADLFVASAANHVVMIETALTGMFAGFFVVPLYALVQQRTAHERLGRVFATNNILNALFMLLGAGLAVLLNWTGLEGARIVLTFALLNALVAVYIFGLVPEFLMRFIVWILVHTLYRVEKRGLEQVPEEGAALLVCNHVSYMDPLVIMAYVRRPIRFVMTHRIFRIPVLSFVFRHAKTIPIAPAREDPELLARAYDRIAEELAAGQLVGIFPEGKLTTDGEMNVFRSGVEQIVARTPVPVIPLALQGLWGSFFSRKYENGVLKLPRRFWSKIGLKVGNTLAPEEVTADELHEQVLVLRGDRH